MGKRLIQQRRGSGTSVYRSNSHRFKGDAKYQIVKEESVGVIKDIINCPGHSAPLVKLKVKGKDWIIIGAEGIAVGQKVQINGKKGFKPGDIAPLNLLPIGSTVFNIESKPGDGGKFVRSSGTFAKITAKQEDHILVKLPSKSNKKFNPDCRASVGRVAGSGRIERPFYKAGKMFHKRKATGRLYPRTSGVAMNAVDHPYGGSSSAHKGTPTIAPKNAPPGRKVGKIRPRRTGKR